MNLKHNTLPKLLSSKELRARGLLNKSELNGEHVTALTTESTEPVPKPEGLLCYFSDTDSAGLLADGSFQLLQKFFALLEVVQAPCKDGLTGLPLRIYPQFEQKEGFLGFRLTASEELLQKVGKILDKINNQLALLRKGKAGLQNISQRAAIVYKAFLKLLRSYRQQLFIYHSEAEAELLLAFDFNEAELLLTALDKIQQEKKQVQLQGSISGFSFNNNSVDFQVLSLSWNGIRTAKSVKIPISCLGDKHLVEFAQKYFEEAVDIEALQSYDAFGNAHYQLLSIAVCIASKKITQRIVHQGPRGGQFYLNYRGQRIYLGERVG